MPLCLSTHRDGREGPQAWEDFLREQPDALLCLRVGHVARAADQDEVAEAADLVIEVHVRRHAFVLLAKRYATGDKPKMDKNPIILIAAAAFSSIVCPNSPPPIESPRTTQKMT